MTKHFLIFIHGIGETYSAKEYSDLLKGIAQAYCDKAKVTENEFYQKFQPIYVNW